MKKFTDLKIAIVHDNIHHLGGAEKILIALNRIFPSAKIYTSTVNWVNLGSDEKIVRELHPLTTWAQKIPLFPEHPILYRYLLPIIWKSINLSDFDLVISSSGSQMSFLINVPKGINHFCYCHTPPRHLYGYATDFDWKRNPFIRIIAGLLNLYLKFVALRSVRKVTDFIANSYEVKKRIKRIYGRESTVINPPVIISLSGKFKKSKNNGYFLSVSRLSRMKHVDLIIKACQELNVSLYVVGTGPEKINLEKLKSKNIRFFGQVSDEELVRLYSNCSAVICAAEDEDFGIVPVEAMSFGKPVVANRSGGFKETVREGKTGLFFNHLTVESLVETLIRLKKTKFETDEIYKQAEKYTQKIFLKKIRMLIRRLND